MDICKLSLQTMKPSESNCISQDQSGMSNAKDYKYDNQKVSTLCCESDIKYSEGKNSQVYVWHISPLWISSKQLGGNQQESKKYEDTEMVSEFCSNSRRRIGLQLSFGKLCRVGTLGIDKQMREENQKKECNYVYAKHEHKHGSDESVFKMSESSERNESERLGHSVSMVVDTFVDESVRHNIAASIYITLIDSKNLEKQYDFYEFIAEFGFEHIIVIGESHYGLLFLDCFGRVFKWEEVQQVIWPLGNSLEEVESKLESNKRLDRVVWTAEYGGVKYQTLPDYDLEMAEQARKTEAKGMKNKHLKKNKKNKK